MPMMTPVSTVDPQALAAAAWWDDFRRTNNDAFLPLLFDEHRYLVLMGGGGSGKSVFAGRKLLERAATEAGHRFLVCRKVGRTIRNSCFEQLCGQVREFYADRVAKIYRGEMRIVFDTGSEILFSGLDDVEKLKSIYAITGIWIEEASELLESDFNQLDIRLRGESAHYKQIILSFNPVSVLHWLKKRFFDVRDDQVLTHHSTYKGNRFLDQAAVNVLEGFREKDPYYYAVYCLGEWGVLGKSVFDAQALTKRLSEAPDGLLGRFEYYPAAATLKGAKWVDDLVDGFIRIYKAPEPGRPYVIGADTAGDGSDWFVAQVVDNVTGEQVATLRQRFGEDLFAHQLWCLGKWYNEALIAVETNFSTYPVRELERLGYGKQYVRERLDEFTHKLTQSFGFATTEKSRNTILAELIRVVRESPELLNDRDTMMEMLTFVRNERFRPEAQEGAHDDTVMALAIAHCARGQQSTQVEMPRGKEAQWTEDMYEDYRAADEVTRKALLAAWGRPKGL